MVQPPIGAAAGNQRQSRAALSRLPAAASSQALPRSAHVDEETARRRARRLWKTDWQRDLHRRGSALLRSLPPLPRLCSMQSVCRSVVTERAEPRQHRLLLRSRLSPPRANRARLFAAKPAVASRSNLVTTSTKLSTAVQSGGKTLAKPPDMPRLVPLVTRCQLSTCRYVCVLLGRWSEDFRLDVAPGAGSGAARDPFSSAGDADEADEPRACVNLWAFRQQPRHFRHP
ncbi:hypothetical protein V8C44DRAFT_34314 [Trichoderma aethiopicum]